VKSNEHIAPFLSQPVNLKVGLNHLGYRYSAELSGSRTIVLCGILNTAHLRCISIISMCNDAK